ncbi:cytochrome p450 protein [Apiospora aurea]|uniref:Cytochrome p450 protein n=1 Tax=Apiospora aurea TaxID=335848 RepID=A0ABR1QNH1_9PEZI
MDANDSVYLGVWTNWSRGRILGSTLTLSRENGNYVIALTAFFIAFVATRFWRVSCFAFHRWLLTSASAETMHRQRQIILCNSSSPESGLVFLSVLLWPWRSLGIRRLFGLSLLILFVVMCVSGFVAAGSFSSRISTDVRNEVLLRADHCGLIHEPSKEENNMFNLLFAQKISSAINYAEQCYSSNRISSMVECERFIVPKLPRATTNYNASCPFQNDICRSNSSNIILDSGYIDSREHLGLNTPNTQRFQQRQVLHCAPLKTEGYESDFMVSDKKFIGYDYGNKTWGSRNDFTSKRYTYQVEDADF